MKDDPKFRKAIEVILEHEGGYVNDPNDPGGETNYGISKRSYPDVDIKNLTREAAMKIYYKDWWKPGRYKEIENTSVAIKMFDLAVNMGQRPAVRLLQRALHAAGKRHVTIDGLIGPQTIGATNEASGLMVLAALRAEAAHYYRRLIERNARLEKFKAGWMNRAYY